MELKEGYKMTDVGVIPEDWDLVTVGQHLQVSAGGTPSTGVQEYWGGDVNWMSSGELHNKRVTDTRDSITIQGLENSAAKMLPIHSVLIGLAGQGKTRGTVAISLTALSTNQSIAAILPNGQIFPFYLYHNLDSRYEELRQMSSDSGGRGGLNLSIIKSIPLPLPPLAEQQAIAEVLSDVDAEIQAVAKLKAKFQAKKEGLMQTLLTGKIRLT